MTNKNGTKKKEVAPVVAAGIALADAVEDIEKLTRRVSKQALGTDAELTRAAELLSKSEQAHRAFLQHLAALAGAVEELRKRQNESARACGERAEQLDARRALHDALAVRFVAIGQGAREVNEMVQAGADGASLEAAQARVAELEEDASALFADAREADLPELEKQAHAMRQQLGALRSQLAAFGEPVVN